MEFIEEQALLFSDLAEEYRNFGQLYTKKLWHQLTEALETFFNNKANHRGDNLINLYENFISKFASRLSQLRLAQLCITIASSLRDPLRAITFLNQLLQQRGRLGADASLCLDIAIISAKLQLGQTDECKVLLSQAKEQLNSNTSNEAVVFSLFYRTQSEYFKAVGPPHEFFASALQYLSYTPFSMLPPDEAYILATDMAIAAITGDNVYNFGEVLATPILSCLANTKNSWLTDLVVALNNGSIDDFNAIIAQHKEEYASQPAFAAAHDRTVQKVVLLSLLNMIFQRSSNDRIISYQDIATTARLPLDQVDWIVMRAMSLGLMKGSMNQVEQTVEVTWIQPRVLGKPQISLLLQQLDGWTDKVKSTLLNVEDQASVLYV